MACEYICDACGKREPGVHTQDGVKKPRLWFSRIDPETKMNYHACSKPCVDGTIKTHGFTGWAAVRFPW